MACLINIYDDVLQGEGQEGILVFEFYDADQDGIEDTGGSILVIDQDGNIDTSGLIAGDYYISHTTGEGDCEQSVIFFIRIINAPNAGVGESIDICNTAPEINLFTLIGGAPDLTGVWSGNGVQSNGYDDNGTPTNPIDDTFDPTQANLGVHTFIYTVSAVAPNGFQLANCPNCAAVFTTVTINVIDCSEPPPPCDVGDSATLNICSGAACSFDLFDYLGGTPTEGGDWTQISGPATIIPVGSEGTVNFNNAPVGVYMHEYSIQNLNPNCSNTAIITTNVVATPNAGNNFSVVLCDTMGNINLFDSLGAGAQSGGAWTITPGLPAGTFINGVINPAVGDAGVYTVTYTVTTNAPNNPCGAPVCTDVATGTVTIIANCNAGANTTTVLCDTGSITLNAITQLGASTNGGTYTVFGQSPNCNNVYGAAVFSVNGGPTVNQQGNTLNVGDVLDDFQSVGCILLIYQCNNGGCTDTASHILQIQDCTPSCVAEVQIEATACNLSIDSLTGCPTPLYQWQIFLSGVWVPAPTPNNLATYTGLNGSTYRLRVTGCPNCQAIFSNQITVACPPSPACSITCVLIYITATQQFKATITNSGGAGASVGYQFNRYTNNNANCLLCSGAQVATCAGNVVVPPMGSVDVFCTVAQQATEQCFRFVTLAGGCNQTLCCAKVPAISALMCYELPTLNPFTDIIGLNVDSGGGAQNIINAVQFSCDEYESTQPQGVMNANINCSLAQLVVDINQWLTANGHSGTASIRQSSKSSTVRIKDTNVIFLNVSSVAVGTINFIQSAGGCSLCDTNSWHFQGLETTSNFPSIGSAGFLNASVPGSINLFTLLDQYFEEIPHTGTFTTAVCGSATAGCVDINTNCCSGGAPPVTVNAGTGLLSWIAFTIPPPLILDGCFWATRYLVTLPNGCQECIIMTVQFKNL